jgi:hypothetical protein
LSVVDTINWEDWLATRPPSVRALAREFPVGTILDIAGERTFVIGYTESDMLILSPTDPTVDYHTAIADRLYVCARHVRAAMVRH